MLVEIPLWEKLLPVVFIHFNSTAAIAKIRNRYYNDKRQQIRQRHSTIREFLSNGAIKVDFVCTDENLADLMTKGLTREKFQNTSSRMGLMPIAH